MDKTSFDPGFWGHWLLVASFCAIAAIGLYLSWQWRKERLERQTKNSLIRRLMQTVHNSPPAEQSHRAKRHRQ